MPKIDLNKYMTNPVDPETGLTENVNKPLPKIDLSKYLKEGETYTPSSGRTLSGGLMNTPEFITDFNLDEGYEKFVPSSANYFFDDVDEMRSIGQGPWRKTGNGLLRLIPSTALKFGEGIGYVAGFGVGGMRAIADRMMGKSHEQALANFTDIMFENFAVDMFHSAEKYMKEDILPVYKQKQYIQGDFLDKITTADFWAEDFIDGVAFAASAFIPGAIASKAGLIGKAGIGAKVVDQSSRVGKLFSNTLGKAKLATTGRINASSIMAEGGSVDDLVRIASKIDTATLTAYNTISEAGFEAKGIRENLLSQGVDLNTANKAALNTFVLNSAALSLSNYWEMDMFFKNPSIARRAMQEAVTDGKVAMDDIIKQTGKRRGQKILRNIGSGIVAEGLWEENVQLAIEKTLSEVALNNPEEISDYSAWMGKIFTQMGNNLFETDGQTGIFLGALLGSGMGISGAIKEANLETEQAKALVNWLNKADVMFKANATSFYQTEEVEQDGKKVRKLKLDAQGKPILDTAAVSKLFYQTMYDKALFDKFVAESVAGNDAAAEMLQEVIFARSAYNALSDPYLDREEAIDLFKTKLKLQADKEIEQGAEKQIVDSILEKNLDKLERYKKLIDGLESRFEKYYEDNIKNEKLKTVIKKVQYAEGVRQLHIEDAIKKNRERESQLSGITPVDNKLLADIQEKEDALNKILEDSYNKFELLSDPKNLKQLETEMTTNDYSSITDEITAKKEELKTAEPDRAVELKQEINYLQNKLNYLHNEQEPKIYGAGLNEQLSYQPKRELLDVGREEILRLKDREGKKQQHLYDVGMSYIQLENLNALIEEYLSNPNKTVEDLQEIINFANNQDNVYALDSNAVNRINELVTQAYEQLKEIEQNEQATVNQINNLTQETLSNLQQRFDELSQQDPNYAAEREEFFTMVSFSYENGMLPDNSLAEEYADVLNNENVRRQELGQALSELDNLKNKIKSLDAPLQSLKERLDKDKKQDLFYTNATLEDLKRDIVEEYSPAVELLIQAYENDKENFAQEEAVQANIDKIEFLIKVSADQNLDLTVNGLLDKMNDHLETLKEMLKVAKENQANRYAKQISIGKRYAKVIFNALGIDVDFINNTYEYNNSPLGKKIREVLGEEFINKLMESAKNEQDPAMKFDLIYAEVLVEKLKLLKGDSRKEVDTLLDNAIESIKNSLQIVDNVSVADIVEDVFRRSIDTMILYNKDYYTKSHPFIKFLVHRNISTGIEDLKSYPADKLFLRDGLSLDNVIERLSTISDYEVLNKLKMFMTTEHGIANTINKELATFTDFKKKAGDQSIPVPTIQQDIALAELVNFYNSTPSTDNERVAYMTGIAGTGKSLIVAKWLKQILGLNTSDVLAVSHNEHSSKNIANSIGQTETITVDQLTDENVKGKKLIIVDEAGAMTGVTGGKLASLAAKHNVKIVAMGDPTQIKASNNDYFTNFVLISPLSIVYRTDVVPIANAADMFQQQRADIENIIFEVDRKLGEPDAKGVQVVRSNADLKKAIDSKDNGNSVIIVANDEQKAAYQQLFPNVEVETYEKVQGRTLTNAYIVFNKNDKNFKGEKFTSSSFNDAMYTSISRATDYVAILDQAGLYDSKVNINIASSKDKNIAEKEANEERYVNRKERQYQIAKDFLDDVPELTTQSTSNEQQADVQQESVDEETIEDFDGTPTLGETEDIDNTDDGTPTNNPPIDVEEPGQGKLHHKLALPITELLKTSERQPEGLIQNGTEVVYIKYDDAGITRYVVMGKLGNSPFWGKVGVVSEDELKNTEVGRLLLTSTAEENFLTPQGNGRFVINEAPNAILLKGVIKDSQVLSYNYTPEVQDTGKGMLQSIIDKFLNGFFRKANIEVPEGTTVSLRIFTNSKVDKEFLQNNNNFTPKLGIPYMVFEFPGTRNKQFIRLNPRKLRATDAPVKTLAQFTATVKQIEAATGIMLGSNEFEELVTNFATNYKADDNTYGITKEGTESFGMPDNVVELFDKLIALTHGYKRVNLTVTQEEFNELYDPNEFELKEIKGSSTKEGEPVKFHVVKKDNDPFAPDKYEKTSIVSRENSIAQKAFNSIARGNSYGNSQNKESFTLNPKFNFVKRIKKPSASNKNIKVDSYTAKSLIGGGEYSKEYFRALNKILTEVLGDGNVTAIGSYNVEIAEKAILENNLMTLQELEDLKKFHQLRVTSQMLEELFQFDENGEHNVDGNYLRLPLILNNLLSDTEDFNRRGQNITDKNTPAENIEWLEDKLSSKLDNVSPSAIVVEIDTQASTESKESTNEPSPSNDDLDNEIGSLFGSIFSRRTYDKNKSTTDLGELVSIEEARQIAKSIIPNISEEDLKIVDRYYLARLANPGEDLLGLMDNGVAYVLRTPEGKVRANIVKHEVFHLLFNHFLSSSERASLIKSLENLDSNTKSLSIIEKEERLAEMFQTYVKQKSKFRYNIDKLFKFLKQVLMFWETHKDNVYDMFEDILQGKYSNNKKDSSFFERRTMLDIKKKFGSTQVYRNLKLNLTKSVNLIITKGYDFGYGTMPVRFDEVLPILKNTLRKESSKIENLINTKKDSLTEEQLRQLESQLSAFKLLFKITKYNKKTKTYTLIIDELLKELYPNYNFKKLQEKVSEETAKDIQEDKTVKIEQEDNQVVVGETVNEDGVVIDASTKMARDHMTETDRVNHESKQTDNVKHFLSTIQIKGKDAFVSSRYAYFKVLQMLSKYTTSDSAEDFVNQITEIANTEKGIYVEEIKEALIKLRNDAEMKGFKEEPDSAFTSEHTYFHKGTVYTTSSFTNKNGKVDKNTITFLLGLRDVTGHSLEYLKKSFIKAQARNRYVEITSMVASQKESRFKIIEETNEYGFTKFSYITGKDLSPVQGIKSDIKNAISNTFGNTYVNNSKEAKSFFTNWFKEFEKTYDYKIITGAVKPKSGESAKALYHFLTSVGYNKAKLSDIEDVHASDILNDLKFFIDRIKNKLGEPLYTNIGASSKSDEELDAKSLNQEEGETNKTFYTILDVLEEDNNILNKFGQLFAANSDFMRATSQVNGDGKKVFLFGNASQAIDTLHNLVRNAIFKNGNIKNLKVPEHIGKKENGVLKVNKQYRNNPIVKGISKVYNYVNHDAIKRNEYATMYSGESDLQWYTRNFVAGFLSELVSPLSTKGSLRYNQFFYTISNRPNIVGAEMRVLNSNEIKEAVSSIIDSMLDRDPNISLYNSEYNPNDNQNFTIVSQEDIKALRDGTISKKEVLDKALANLMDKADNFTDQLLSLEIPLDKDLNRAYNKLIDEGYIKSDHLSNEDHKSFVKDKSTGERKYVVEKEILSKIIQVYFANNYVNSYALNHIVTGDFASFKSSLDLIKRMSGVFSPGQKGNTEYGVGMKKEYKTVVLRDTNMQRDGENNPNSIISFLKQFLSTEEANDLVKMFGKDFDSTDAQGFITPQRQLDIIRGFSDSYNPGSVLKPTHYQPVVKRKIDVNGQEVEIDTPYMVKYSAIVLTDELVSKFPKLGLIRQAMDNNQVDELIFETALKVGKPSSEFMATTQDIYDTLEKGEEFKFHPNSISTLSNEYYRLQLNPSHEVDSLVSNPTQLIYFLSALENNEVEAKRVYSALAKLMTLNDETINKKLNNPLQTAIDGMEGVEGSERIAEIIKATGSLNFPAVTDKSIIQIANAISKLTVKVKLPGSKLVLQSQEGVEITRENGTKDRLRYKLDKDGRMYAEVIVPNSYKELTQAGDYLLPDMLGFRIPSSELHSGVALKIVGYYDSLDTNVIIAPAELVPLHGSDFDVDSLFVIRRETYKKDDKKNNPDSKKGPVGYELNKSGKYEINYKFEPSNNDEATKYYKNVILESILEIITKKENRPRMLSPITMERLKNLEIVQTKKKQQGKMDLSNPSDNYKVFKSNFDGLTLTGIFANAMKSLAYIVKSGQISIEHNKQSSIVSLKKGISFSIDENTVEFKTLSEYEYGTNKPMWQSLDSLLNAAIDNVKEQIIPFINATDATGNPLSVMLAMGIPLEVAVSVMTQPSIVELARLKPRKTTVEIDNIRKQILTKLNLESLDNITEVLDTKKLYEISISGKTFEELIKSGTEEELKFQYAVLTQFRKMVELGDDLQKVSSIANLVKEIPVFYEDMQKLDDTLNSVFDNLQDYLDGVDELKINDSFNFVIPNFLDRNEHITEAIRYFYKTKNTIENNIFKHSNVISEFIESLSPTVKNFKFEAGNEFAQQSILKSHIISYLITSTSRVQDKIAKGNQNPYVFRIRNKEITQSGVNAWSTNFINELEQIRKDFPSNKFLSFIEIEQSKSGRKYIRFTAGTNLIMEDLIDLQDSYAELPEQLQNDLADYAIINNGMSFGLANYTVIIPDNILKEIAKDLDSTLNSLTPEKLSKLKDHFEISFALNNAAKLPYFKKKQHQEDGFNKGEDAYTAYDLRFKIEDSDFDKGSSEVKESVYPKFAKVESQNGIKVFVRIGSTSPDSKFVYYQQIGYGNKKASYELEADVLKNGYSFTEYFRNMLSIKLKSLNENQIVSYLPIKEGKEFIGYTDTFRKVRALFRVTKVVDTTNDSLVEGNYVADIVKVGEVSSESFDELSLNDYYNMDRSDVITNRVKIEEELSKGDIRSAEELDKRIAPLLTPQAKAIYDKVKHKIDKNIKLTLTSDKSFRSEGTYSPDKKVIKIKKGGNSNISATILHELFHDILFTSLYNYRVDGGNALTERQKEAIKALEELRQEVLERAKQDNTTFKTYGLSANSLDEFVNELMTNSGFQAYLNNIIVKKGNVIQTMFNRILKVLMSIMGLEVKTNSALYHGMNEVFYLLEGNKPEYSNKMPENLSLEKRSAEQDDFLNNFEEYENILQQRIKSSQEIKTKLIEASSGITVDKNEKGEELDTYNNGKYFRITSGPFSFISNFLNRKKQDKENVSFAERKADAVWNYGAIDKDTVLKTDLGDLNKEDYIKKYDAILLTARKKGKIVHKIIERIFTKEESKINEINNEITQLLSETGERIHYYEWIYENLEVVLANAGINAEVKRTAEGNIIEVITKQDVISELTISSDIFGYAGTIDSLIKNEDGTFSIIDWKTGAKFDDEVFNNLLKYGDQILDVTDNQRQRAKLQVMMYAVMLKAENPDIQFKNLMAIWLPNRYQSTKIDHKRQVEVNVYLNMIKSYLKEQKPEIYDKLLKENPAIFEISSYNYHNDRIVKDSKTLTAGEQLDLAKQKLKEIINRTAFSPELSLKDKERVSELTKDIIKLEKDESVVLHDSEDISFSERWLGTYGDVNNPYLQTYKKILVDAKQNADEVYSSKKAEFDRKLLPVLNEYLISNGRNSISKLTYRNLNFIKYYVGDGTGLYDFAYKTRAKDDYTYKDMITPSDVEWQSLNENQKALLRFIQETFSEYFVGPNSLMKQVAATKQNGDPITNEDLVNRSRKNKFEYTSSFLPRVPIDNIEFRQRNSIFSKDVWKHYYHKYMTLFYENNYEQWSNEHEALPIKYLGNDYQNTENYSLNLENIFDRFVRNMEMKKELDPVHAIGRGLQIYYKMKDSKDYSNTVDFLEDHILLDILDRKHVTNFFRKKVRVNGNQIDVSKVFRSLKNAVAAPIMWLQPINGTRNALFISMLNAKKSIADSVTATLPGIDQNVVDFTMTDMAEAWKEWTAMQKDFMTGKGKYNKAWLLVKKFKYLPDNYDWASQPKELLGQRRDISSTLFGAKTMYMFHSIPEEWNATMVMIAQMKRMQHKGKSLWDNYEVVEKDGIPEVVWTGGIRGIVKDKDGLVKEVVEGITPREAEKMKRVYQMMHGGYRRDERTAMEAYVLGEIFLQFKKYLPSILMNAFRSKSEDLSIGYYKFTGDKHNGEDVIQWQSKIHEGRWLVLGKMLGHYLINKEKYKDYKFENLSDETKKQMIDAWFTIGTWIMAYGAYLFIFGDTDDDDSWKRLYKVMMDNYSQQYNLLDIGKNFTTMPATFTKSYDTFDAATTMFISSVAFAAGYDEYATTQKGDLKGWTQVKRSIPYVSSYYNLQRFAENDKTFEFIRVR